MPNPVPRCKNFQGGATTFTQGIRFHNAANAPLALSSWSWGHQVGI